MANQISGFALSNDPVLIKSGIQLHRFEVSRFLFCESNDSSMSLYFLSGIFPFSAFFFFSQSFLDLEYAFLEVTTEEPTKVEQKNFYFIPPKKIKKKKKRKMEISQLKTGLATKEEILQPASKVASLAGCHNEPVSQNDTLPQNNILPDISSSFDSVPCTTQIESPA